MPGLLNLTTEQKQALGKELPAAYMELQAEETIKDTKKAQDYVSGVTRRYTTISKASTGDGFAEIKEQYLKALQAHGSEMAVKSYSKPEEISNVLKSLGHKDDAIEKIVKAMEQPGATEDDLCCILTSTVTCETSSAILAGGGHHHHHHHHGHW